MNMLFRRPRPPLSSAGAPFRGRRPGVGADHRRLRDRRSQRRGVRDKTPTGSAGRRGPNSRGEHDPAAAPALRVREVSPGLLILLYVLIILTQIYV